MDLPPDRPGRSPSRSPTVQRSASTTGARLHFNYSGKETKIRSRQEKPKLPRQQTVDYASYTRPTPSYDSQPRTSYYDSYDTKDRSRTESLGTTSSRLDVPNLYASSSSHQQRSTSPRLSPSLLLNDVTRTTSSAAPSSLLPPLQHSTISDERRAPEPPVRTNQPMSYGYTPRVTSYSDYDYQQPSSVSPQIPTHSVQTTRSQKPYSTDFNSSLSSSLRNTNSAATTHTAARTTEQSVARQPPPTSPYNPRPQVSYTSTTLPSHSLLPPQNASSHSTARAPQPSSLYSTPSTLPPHPPRHQSIGTQSLLTDQQQQQNNQLGRPVEPTSIPPRSFYSTSPSRPPPVARQSSITIPETAPQSLNAKLAMSHRSRTLNIGSSDRQRREIEEAQRLFAAEVAKNEAATREKLRLEAEKRRAEEEAKRSEANRLEAIRRAEMAAKLQAAERKAQQEREEAKRAEIIAKLEAARLAEEAQKQAEEAAKKAAEEARRRATGGEPDDEVEKFIQSLEQRVKDSQNSKNLQGALVGRQINQNPAKPVGNLTNALKIEAETEEKIEGGDVSDQRNTQSVADNDNSEEYNFLERVRNMKSDKNANRIKYAEHYYDYDDDDSDLNSVNSFLSTVTEEDPDSFSVHMLNSYIEPEETEKLPPSVISYVDELVDGIFSSLEKTHFQMEDIIPMKKSVDADLYANDANYNYQVISENAKQFFTPRNSAENEHENDNKEDNIESIIVKFYD